LSNLIPKDPTPDTNKNAATENPTSWMHSGRTFSTVEEASTSTDENQPHEKTEYSVNDDEQLRPFSTVQSVATLKSITIDGEENFEKAAANEHDGYTASHQTSPEPRSIGVFAGSVLLTARVALGIITGGTVTLIDGGRDLYVGTRDGIINKAALGASKLAAGAAILIGITSANPALLAGGAIIYSSCLLFEYRAAITLHGKRIWDWFKS